MTETKSRITGKSPLVAFLDPEGQSGKHRASPCPVMPVAASAEVKTATSRGESMTGRSVDFAATGATPRTDPFPRAVRCNAAPHGDFHCPSCGNHPWACCCGGDA